MKRQWIFIIAMVFVSSMLVSIHAASGNQAGSVLQTAAAGVSQDYTQENRAPQRIPARGPQPWPIRILRRSPMKRPIPA